MAERMVQRSQVLGSVAAMAIVAFQRCFAAAGGNHGKGGCKGDDKERARYGVVHAGHLKKASIIDGEES